MKIWFFQLAKAYKKFVGVDVEKNGFGKKYKYPSLIQFYWYNEEEGKKVKRSLIIQPWSFDKFPVLKK